MFLTDSTKMLAMISVTDQVKASSKAAIAALHQSGIKVKMLTGDNPQTAQYIGEQVGLQASDIVAEVLPEDKAQVVKELQSNGQSVGMVGDGINDAPALRAADVGISVDTAADITKDASSIILLEKSLNVLDKGVIEGRKVFTNMMKYIKMTLSSNFGNVFSILVASAFLPFLPMLSIQLLVQNLVYDMAQLTIPWDNVDDEELQAPTKWETTGLLKFTVCIGPISSVFDIITFLVMWFIFGANTVGAQNLFQTGWFMIGLTTQALVQSAVFLIS